MTSCTLVTSEISFALELYSADDSVTLKSGALETLAYASANFTAASSRFRIFSHSSSFCVAN